MSIFTPEIITGLISLGSGAFSGLMANNQKMTLHAIELARFGMQEGNKNANDAAARGKSPGSFSQKFAVVTIILLAFFGLWFAALLEMPTTYIYEEPGRKFLGFIGSGADRIKSITAEGFVLPPYVKYSVISIVNFLFGASVVKLRRV